MMWQKRRPATAVCVCAVILTLAYTLLLILVCTSHNFSCSLPSSGIHILYQPAFFLHTVFMCTSLHFYQPTHRELIYIFVCVGILFIMILSFAVLCAKNLAKKDFFRKYLYCAHFHVHVSCVVTTGIRDEMMRFNAALCVPSKPTL